MSHKYIKLSFLSLLVASCSLIISLDKKYNHSSHNYGKKDFSIIYSHSIMGETHPCGCRHFPLGGLPQVAGLFHELKEKKDIFYIDTGDALFPTPVIPKHISKSARFGALNLARGLDKLGLKYMLIGDNDLALGFDFLNELKKEVSFEFLISNLKDDKVLTHKKYATIELEGKKIFLVALVKRDLMPFKYQKYFTPMEQAMDKALKDIKELGFEKENKNHQLIVLSHSGIKADEVFAEKYPRIDWIIGSHSQSFTNFSYDVGETRIVQVLSKNHYLGEVKLAYTGSKKEAYAYHEIRDELHLKIPDNPFHAYIQEHKTTLEKIRDDEQKAFSNFSSSNEKLKTAASCIECHTPQGEKWMKTSHSISYHTLVQANERNNTACIKCHSVGLGDKNGFVNVNDMVLFENRKTDQKTRDQYWKEVANAFGKDVGSIRKLSEKKRMALSKKWLKIDKKFAVEHNFSNVQCLNCHDQHMDHPFHISNKPAPSRSEKLNKITKNCLNCHTSEQSPEWYKKNDRGLYDGPNQKYVQKMIRKVACPLN
ncbi:MAG: hypothetical protein CME69_00095 [Halobacteriovorax sp.]|nr:hypothetical protein [Halobacteriovorax sp.]